MPNDAPPAAIPRRRRGRPRRDEAAGNAAEPRALRGRIRPRLEPIEDNAPERPALQRRMTRGREAVADNAPERPALRRRGRLRRIDIDQELMEVQAIDVMPEDRQNGINNAPAVPEMPLDLEFLDHGRTFRLKSCAASQMRSYAARKYV